MNTDIVTSDATIDLWDIAIDAMSEGDPREWGYVRWDF